MDTREKLLSSLLSFSSDKVESLKREFTAAFPSGKASFESDAARINFAKLFFRNLRLFIENQMDKSISGAMTFYNQDTKDLLYFLFWAANYGLVEQVDSFFLMEDIYDCLPISEIFVFFEFLEELVKQQKKPLGNKQHMSFIRIGNGILRKLSKVHDNVFRGRVQLLLATVDSLVETTPQQKRIVINPHNHMDYEKKINDKQQFVKNLEKEDSRVSFSFYQRFWELQKYLHNPGLLFNSETTILLEPEDYEDLEIDPEVPEVPASVATKKKITVDTKIEAFCGAVQKIVNIFKNDPTSDYSEVPYIQRYPKYSTKSSLLNIQLRDPGFRKTIILQIFIATWCLKNPITIDNQKLELKEKEIEKIANLEKSVVELAKSMKDEKEKASFYDKISPFLEHEKFWSNWKEKGCPSLEKAASPDLIQNFNNAKTHADIITDIMSVEKKPGNPKQFPDFKIKDKLYNEVSGIANKFARDTYFENESNVFKHLNPIVFDSQIKPIEPSVSYYFDIFLNELKDPDMREEDKVANNENMVWQAYRALARNWIKLFQDAMTKKDNDYELKLSDILKKLQGKPEVPEKMEQEGAEKKEEGGKTPVQPIQSTPQDSAAKEVKEEPKQEPAPPKKDMVPETKPSTSAAPAKEEIKSNGGAKEVGKPENRLDKEKIEEKLKAKKLHDSEVKEEAIKHEEGEVIDEVNVKRSPEHDISEYEKDPKKQKQ